MAKIAEAAGIAKPVVYDAFPGGKQELYYAILDRGQASFVAYLSAVLERGRGLPLDESLRAGLKGFLDYAEHEPAAFRVIFGSAGTTNPEIARRTEAVREEVVRTMTDRTMDTLGLAETVRPAAEVYIRGIVAVAEELARWTARRPDLSRDVLVDLVVAWFMRGFDGVLGLGSPGDPSGLPAS